MNSVLKNIRATLRQLFGFDEIEESKEWNEYLAVLGQNGYFSSQEIEDFNQSEKYMARLEKKLEEPEENIKNRKNSFQGNSLKLTSKAVEQTMLADAKGKERE